MLHLIPMDSLSGWANTQISAMSSVAKGFFTAVVVLFFGINVLRSKFAISAIVMAIAACALFVWVVDYDGLTTIATMIRDQANSK